MSVLIQLQIIGWVGFLLLWILLVLIAIIYGKVNAIEKRLDKIHPIVPQSSSFVSDDPW